MKLCRLSTSAVGPPQMEREVALGLSEPLSPGPNHFILSRKNRMAAPHTTRMLILGSGPPGLSAATYGARPGLAPLVVKGLYPGAHLPIPPTAQTHQALPDL